MFVGIFHDYLKRFKVKPTTNKTHIAICGTREYNEALGVATEAEGRIHVEVCDPSLEYDGDHLFVYIKFAETLAHEMVHVMQALTSHQSEGFDVVRHDKRNAKEEYFFSPAEVEARVLEAFYADTYGSELMVSTTEEEE